MQLKFSVLLTFSIFLPVFAEANVTINEIAWMGTVPKEGESAQAAANNEWIELTNSGSETVLLDGWKLIAEDGAPDIALSGAIPAGGYFLLERGSDEVAAGVAADLIYSFKNNALSNSGERLFLRDASGAVHDEMNASSDWPAGSNETKETMQRLGSAWITATGTPRAANHGVVSGAQTIPINPSGTALPSSNSSGSSIIVLPSIRADAGGNKVTVVGTEAEFIGSAFGVKGEPIENARFWWNFGDGETREGRSVMHIFQSPGKYTVGLHVSSGSYSASDYISVAVSSNQLIVAGVLEGENGFLRLANRGDNELDIENWVIEERSGARFIVPPKTRIGPHAEVGFSNRATGLLQGKTSFPLKMIYPNAEVAFTYFLPPVEKTSQVEAAQQVYRGEDMKRGEVKVSQRRAPQDELALTQGGLQKEETKPDHRENGFATVQRASNSFSLFFWFSLLLGLMSAIGFLIVKHHFLHQR